MHPKMVINQLGMQKIHIVTHIGQFSTRNKDFILKLLFSDNMWISPADVIKMDGNRDLSYSEENIYEEINSLTQKEKEETEPEEQFSLLHGISAGRRELLRNYALADWDFEQKFHDPENVKEDKLQTLVRYNFSS